MADDSNMTVDYSHDRNLHTVSGAKAALARLFETGRPQSLLDVGCGRGTWLRAATDLGVQDICGLDGVDIAERDLLFPASFFQHKNLAADWNMERNFDLVTCLEVAEHLPAESAPQLVASLVRHSETILFSAAAPGQTGQHHVNCQWPDYWQRLFNAAGYVCNDAFRWTIWDMETIEPWYRQNIFTAKRAPTLAGKEPRIRAVIHPDMLQSRCFDVFEEVRSECFAQIEAGARPISYYASLLVKVPVAKARRKVASTNRS